MPERTRAKDKSSIQQCRIELSKLIDDMGLSVYAFRLYAHLKRIADEKDGSCWESARTLAAACCMSPGQVSKAKDELEQRGLIVRNIKTVRGGIGDDITIVDIWPQTFERYAPASGHKHESDHHTIASTTKVITTRSLSESDHSAITSSQSDQAVIALSIKRSYSDPIDHDLPYKEDHDHVGDDGDERTLAFLVDKGMSAAQEFADLPYESMRADYEARCADGQNNAQIVRAWRLKRPTRDYRYERRANGRPVQSESAPRQSRRSAVAAPNPAVDAEFAALLEKFSRPPERGGD